MQQNKVINLLRGINVKGDVAQHTVLLMLWPVGNLTLTAAVKCSLASGAASGRGAVPEVSLAAVTVAGSRPAGALGSVKGCNSAVLVFAPGFVPFPERQDRVSNITAKNVAFRLCGYIDFCAMV